MPDRANSQPADTKRETKDWNKDLATRFGTYIAPAEDSRRALEAMGLPKPGEQSDYFKHVSPDAQTAALEQFARDMHQDRAQRQDATRAELTPQGQKVSEMLREGHKPFEDILEKNRERYQNTPEPEKNALLGAIYGSTNTRGKLRDQSEAAHREQEEVRGREQERGRDRASSHSR